MDSTIKFDIEKQKEDIVQVFYDLSPQIAVKSLRDVLEKKGIDMSDNFFDIEYLQTMRDKYISKEGKLDSKNLRLEMISNGYTNKQWQIFKSILSKYFSDENMKNEADKVVKRFKRKLREIRKLNYVSCLSETHKNNFMWINYAGKRSGFCIEYDMKTQGYEDIKFNISPIYYGNREILDLPSMLEYSFKQFCYKYKDQNLEHQLAIDLNMQIRSKDKDFIGEIEWRYIVYKDNMTTNRQPFPFAKRIYLGCEMTDSNRRKLLNIASTKGLEVYQQKFDEIQSKYDYYKVL